MHNDLPPAAAGGTPRRIVVVGASLAGVRTLKALRRKGYERELVFVGDEDELPYDRPPLSKAFLTDEAEPALKLLEPEGFYDDVQLRLGVTATGIGLDGAVELSDGSSVTADHVVIATGARARSLPSLGGERVGCLRTAHDARRLREALSGIDHLLVVGGGFIGCEVAASARKRGVAVTLVEPQQTLVARGLAEPIARWLEGLHREAGVDVRLGVAVEALERTASGAVARLTDGSTLETGFVCVGVGATPNVDWLGGSGLAVDNGVVCDERCRVVGGGGRIWAAGDVASWHSVRAAATRRVEHWTNAAEQANVVASNILGDAAATVHDPIPYVWSDQLGHKLQMLGDTRPTDELTCVSGALEAGKFAFAASRAGRLTGLIASDSPREVARYRPHIAASTLLEDMLTDGLRAAGTAR